MELEFCGAANPEEITAAERSLGRALPTAIREMYARPRRFLRGDNGRAWVEIYSPSQAVEMTNTVRSFPGREGMFLFGGDGSRDMLLIDETAKSPTVYCIDITGSWKTAIKQAQSVSEVMDRLEDGSFYWAFDD